jgi:hypothetical protein
MKNMDTTYKVMANGYKLAEFKTHQEAKQYILDHDGNDPTNVEQMYIVKQSRA